MAKFTLKNYNLFLARGIKEYGISRREAAKLFREIKSRSGGKSPFQNYFGLHPRVSARLVAGVQRGRGKPPAGVGSESLPPRQREEDEETDFDETDELDFEATGDGGEYKKTKA